MTLSQTRVACKAARAECIRELKAIERDDRTQYRWIRSRQPMLIAIDSNGERMSITNDGIEFRWRMSQIDDLVRRAGPNCAKVNVDSGVNFAETREDLDNFNYGTLHWSVCVYDR